MLIFLSVCLSCLSCHAYSHCFNIKSFFKSLKEKDIFHDSELMIGHWIDENQFNTMVKITLKLEIWFCLGSVLKNNLKIIIFLNHFL